MKEVFINSKEKVYNNVGSCDIQNSEHQKLLGGLNDLCARASRKLNALCRVSLFMRTNKKRQVMKDFMSYQLSYCLIIWMNHSRTFNNKINKRHKRSLQVVYNDIKTTFKELLDKDKIEVASNFPNKQFLRKNKGFKPCNHKTVYYETESISLLGTKL